MEKALRFEKPNDVFAAVGHEICLSEWFSVDQPRIDKFAEATGDFQWIHVDVERAKSSPYGGTIAHGFLTLSLLGGFYEPYLQHAFPFCDLGLNYGLNKVRFTAPVRTGSRVRGRIVLAKVEEIPGGLQLISNITIEIEGQEKPALVAESVVRRYFTKGRQ
jgi:acyl dehydratase